MSQSASEERAVNPPVGLRERKKARTRSAIQEQAMRLFREQGYGATTVEQIAEAAEISPSTFFRYFPAKEDVVMYDAFDPVVIEAFRAQPPVLGPVRALRKAMQSVFSQFPAEDMAVQVERDLLIRSTPELRARMLDEFGRSIGLMAEVVADRIGRRPDDPTIRALAGAVVGIGIAAWSTEGGGGLPDMLGLLDEGLAQLEAGFPL
jgi:AcrR family transcriptional regulator